MSRTRRGARAPVAARAARAAGAGIAVAASLQLLPALTTVAPARRRLAPRLGGLGRRDHVALTFDDGPDPVSTPRFLDLLAEHDVRATFFLLGAEAQRCPGLVREMAAAGHELALHGWDHTCIALKRPARLSDELRRGRDVVEDLGGHPPRWYRPPYGVTTTSGLVAARAAGMQTVLWSAWGVDWSARATPGSVVGHVSRAITPGGTVLLHDTDRASAPGSWRRTLPATATLLDDWAGRDVLVGPLRDHW